MCHSSSPLIFWDKCFQIQCLIHSHTALNLPTLKGMTPEERLKGETADISLLIEFQWYQRVWYIDPTDKYVKCHLGRWLCPCNTAGGGMASWILTMKATEEVRTSVIPLTQQDLNNDEVRLKVKEFDKKLIDKLKERVEPLPTDQEEAMPTYEHHYDDDTKEEDTSTPDVDMSYMTDISLLESCCPLGTLWQKPPSLDEREILKGH